MGAGEGKMSSRQSAGLSWEESKERRHDQKPGRRATVVIPRGPGFSLVTTLW
jgi:hypothetical protein